ncbi:MAG: hypothetical protein RSP_04710 [Rhodanobacter sp.]
MKLFHVERARAPGTKPRVVFISRERGEGRTKRIVARLPLSLWQRLPNDSHVCSHAGAMAVLAHEGLNQLIDTQQRLISAWIPESKGGRFHHILMPQERGIPRIDGGNLPHTSAVHRTMVTLPNALQTALRSEGRHVSTSLVALADWQLNQLIDGREQIRVTPLREPKASRE